MNLIILGIIAVTTFVNISSYFVLLAKTPQYTVFTGAVHYPMDYLDYLGYIIQGKYHWLLASNLKSGETIQLKFLNWIYVLGGHLGWILHLSPQITYQFMVVASSVAYLITAYFVMKLLFPKNNSLRLLAFVLFIISNAFPKIYQNHGSWIFSYYYPYENWGQPLIRLTNVPHQLLIQAAIMAAFVSATLYWRRRDRLSLVVLALSGFFLSSSQPVQWALVCGVLGLGGIFAWIQKYKNEKTHEWVPEIAFICIPSIVFFATGLPGAVYLKYLSTQPPFSTTALWESMQQTRIPFTEFITLNGPIMITALIGLLFIRELTVPSVLLLCYSVFSIGLFFSPIPSMVGLSNNRFLSVIPTLTFAYISTELFWLITGKFLTNQRKVATWFCAFLVIAITIPVTIEHIVERTHYTEPQDINGYLPLGAKLAYDAASNIVGANDTVLVTINLDQSFPAFTGKHVFVTDEFSTIDYARKNAEEIQFFNAQDLPQMRIDWLKKNHISYILTYAWAPVNLPGLTIVYQNMYAILYKVTGINK